MPVRPKPVMTSSAMSSTSYWSQICADAREVVGGRDDHAAGALHRLGDEGRHRAGAFLQDRLFQLVGCGHAKAHARVGGHEAVGVGRLDVAEARRARLEHRPEGRQPGGAHGRQRQAMVGAMARDDLDLVGLAERLPVEARGLERALGRLGPAAREEERVDRGVGQAAQALSQLDGLLVGAACVGGVERQRGHLFLGGVGQFAPAVADVDVPQARQAVEVLTPGGVGDARAVALDPDACTGMRRRVVQRVHQVRLIGGKRCGWHELLGGRDPTVIAKAPTTLNPGAPSGGTARCRSARARRCGRSRRRSRAAGTGPATRRAAGNRATGATPR